MLVGSSVTTGKQVGIVCGNIMVLFYCQLNFKLVEMNPKIRDCVVLMPTVSSFLFMLQNVYLWKNDGIGVEVKHSTLCSCF